MRSNPLTPKSDKDLISSYSITLGSNIKVTGIRELIVELILLVSTLGNVQGTV